MTIAEIKGFLDESGFINGDKFRSIGEVRRFLSVREQVRMFGRIEWYDTGLTQRDLDQIANYVIRRGYHMADAQKEETMKRKTYWVVAYGTIQYTTSTRTNFIDAKRDAKEMLVLPGVRSVAIWLGDEDGYDPRNDPFDTL
jgi:hypothetical protein